MANVTLFRAENPGLYKLSDIYDPDILNGTGYIIPVAGSLVIDHDNDGLLYWVESVNQTTYKSKLVAVKLLVTSEDGDTGLTSIVSYGNDIFRVYYDTRTNPKRLNIDSRLVIYGTGNAEYQLVKNRGTPDEVVISQYYDSSGNYHGTRVPLSPVDQANQNGTKFCTNCHTTHPLVDGDEIAVEIYSDHGALTALVNAFAKESKLLNEDTGLLPVITGMTLNSTQKRGNDEIYIYEKQDPDSLNISATIHYDDGHFRDIDIDGDRCRIYGLEDFVASYPGLVQTVVVKYFLSNDEAVSLNITETTGNHVSAEIKLVVIPNELASGIKVSVIPRWSISLNKYVLHFYAYTTDRNEVTDVTAYTTIENNGFNGNTYGTTQVFNISVDMGAVDPTTYTQAAIYRQTSIIKLAPIAAYERYTIRDASNSLYVYGIDASSSRRPVLHYDASLQQYFVPTTIFQNKEAFIKSFYTNAAAPYDTRSEVAPLVPTHFVLRDIVSGTVLTAAPIPVDQYLVAFSIIGTPADRLANTNVIVEFIRSVDIDTDLILYGAPVDVHLSQNGYQSP